MHGEGGILKLFFRWNPNIFGGASLSRSGRVRHSLSQLVSHTCFRQSKLLLKHVKRIKQIKLLMQIIQIIQIKQIKQTACQTSEGNQATHANHTNQTNQENQIN